ncbi:16553_t:CDS:2, partial [Entrophospora sp. SA101]
DILKINPIFHTNAFIKQIDVNFQVSVFLRRLAIKGDIFTTSSLFGISEGTVILYTNRIIKAILETKNNYVKWPVEQYRHEILGGFQQIGGFPNVIGAIDGTHINLTNAPSKDPEVFFNLSQTSTQIQFNQLHSKHRIVVEHAFGRLKSRFVALRELNVKSIKMAVRLTECAIILHNFLELNGEIWDEGADVNDYNDNDANLVMECESELGLKRAGEEKRNQLINFLRI